MNSKTFFICLLTLLSIGSHQYSWSQVLSNETHITIDGKGRKKTERTVLIQVNDKMENYLAHVEIMHDPRMDFSFKYARIIDSNGNILRKLRKKDLSTRNALSYAVFFQDDLVTEFNLYWHQYPYLLEYSYSIEEREFVYVSYWTPILYPSIPTLAASLEVNIPLDYAVHISEAGPVGFKESVVGDKKVYLWESTFPGKIENEIFSPPVEEFIPRVRIVPEIIEYGVTGSSESWSSFGTWLRDLNEGTDILPLKEKKFVERLVEGTKSKREIIQKIYYYLQDHTRYINVAIDVGGLKSYSADYVCTNKYGDCKALTTYMKSMLKSIGIRSLYTVINAGKNEARINQSLPGQQFNHVILAVPLEKDTIWLENTSGSLPFNYLGTFTQNRYALAVDGDNSKLVKTPPLKPSEVFVQRNYEFNFDEDDQWRVEANLDLRGDAFEDFRHLLSNNEESNLRLELYNNLGIEGLEIRDWNMINFHRDSSNLKISARGEVPDPVREIAGWKVINPLKISIPDFEKPGDRTLDVRINYPINKADKIVFNLKKRGDKEVQIPESVFIKSDYGLYSFDFCRENNSIIAYENFTLFHNDIPIDEYPEFYSFIQSIIDQKKRTAILIK